MLLEIDGWKVGLKFSASHFIPSHHKCSRLHGHDYGVRLRIFGETKDHILYDFVELKNEVRSLCEELDHKLLIPKSKKYIRHHIKDDRIYVSFEDKHYVFPKGDVTIIPVNLITAEELARYFSKKVLERIRFPENVKGIEICVDEGPGQGACNYIPLGDEK
ncbi:6-carboxytetrahydropterin synthase [Candidatus Aciduliprofundum boonei]|uniref:6-pyruvoyl tetrahydropterin synthase family protein n=1 Tax=Aciduliprofundum boonei (strain DSM 19572 / T469) TaxID=439481 RepID=B5I9Q5_ACIB4|nr:6-carboxytetrahydropterin synthase [Candidatus Aciduliprofundum boonei]ADD08469.1 6-pyruvoyl tetrahydropterin synthase and hypothetical protein [Aciduliprofundum boonei T469]EDY37052.1 hypothetical protein ABOONEI_1973 [Aciduliprofundum boonei T469]HII55326.1 6-pyruvoyl tetrahydropterin synthase family protein [Candidatus Aciduliprofundum boonei]